MPIVDPHAATGRIGKRWHSRAVGEGEVTPCPDSERIGYADVDEWHCREAMGSNTSTGSVHICAQRIVAQVYAISRIIRRGVTPRTTAEGAEQGDQSVKKERRHACLLQVVGVDLVD